MSMVRRRLSFKGPDRKREPHAAPAQQVPTASGSDVLGVRVSSLPSAEDEAAESPISAASASPTGAQLEEAIADVIRGGDLESMSLRTLREELEARLLLGAGCLEERREEIAELAQRRIQQVVNDSEAQAAAARARKIVRRQQREHRRMLKQAKAKMERRGGCPNPKGAKSIRAGCRAWASKRKRRMPPRSSGNGLAKDVEEETQTPRKLYGYMAYFQENKTALKEELFESPGLDGKKPSMKDLFKTAGERWRALPAETKAKYNRQEGATVTTGSEGSAQPPARRSPGKARSKESVGAAVETGNPQDSELLTRAMFLRLNKVLRINLIEPSATEATQAPEGLSTSSTPNHAFELLPRLFKTGSAGWYYGGKLAVALGGIDCTVAATINLVVSGSKGWSDGEAAPEQASSRGLETQEGDTLQHTPLASYETEGTHGVEHVGGKDLRQQQSVSLDREAMGREEGVESAGSAEGVENTENAENSESAEGEESAEGGEDDVEGSEIAEAALGEESAEGAGSAERAGAEEAADRTIGANGPKSAEGAEAAESAREMGRAACAPIAEDVEDGGGEDAKQKADAETAECREGMEVSEGAVTTEDTEGVEAVEGEETGQPPRKKRK
eukprot:CAMPEP_0117460526 /NCGR_PEP_ID=MMETSP0784-20121206/2052_1 /TAXON_ID=39447 /ORGANISM="" /LENGTH=617 /DNA_ID=CAMNT_0005254199 /DNA_START=11 /DNA_END=1864 /DNA_ORIENTATION=+